MCGVVVGEVVVLLLEVDDFVCLYGMCLLVVVVYGILFIVVFGEMFGIVGELGLGKLMLLWTIVGFYVFDLGWICFVGEEFFS